MKNNKLQYTLKISFLIAIEFLFCFTPLGSIPVGPIVATLSAIPVIITSIIFGVGEGMILGLLFGIFSFIYWTFIMPASPVAFLFTPFSEFTEFKGNVGSIIICFVPRILLGLTPALIMGNAFYKGERSFSKEQCELINTEIVRMVIASVIGSMTNTIFVMLFIFLFFRHEYETLMGQNILIVISATILTNGIPEAVVAGIVCPVVSRVINKLQL